MLPPIPSLSDYGISPEYGFLPPEAPLEVLPHPYYAKWEAAIANLHALLLSRRLRRTIAALPVLSTRYLKSEAEWRRAYVILSMLLHSYIWGGDQAAERVPPTLTIPLFRVCDHLELPPVATYAGVCLWNWRPIVPDEPTDILDNLACINTFTGSMDEQWFYLISVAIEARGASTIPVMLRAISAARLGDRRTVTECLQMLAERLDEIGSILLRMYEDCDPHVFYHRIRPFLAGSKNMADAGLPQGVIYEDGSGIDEYRQYGGGSNAQSSLIQFFDVVLGIEHRPTGVSASHSAQPSSSTQPLTDDTAPEPSPPPRHGFIQEMRQYMPGPHRRFLEHVSSIANIREFVGNRRFDRELCVAYDACLAMLRSLRDRHIQIVSRYIIVKSRESRASAANTNRSPIRSTESSSKGDGLASSSDPNATHPRRTTPPNSVTTGSKLINLATASANKSQKASNLRGTGGTALIPFLKQARDETGEPAIDAWARRVLSNGPVIGAAEGERSKSKSSRASLIPTDPILLAAYLGKVDEHADGQMEIIGLAGTWTMDDSEGGICHW